MPSFKSINAVSVQITFHFSTDPTKVIVFLGDHNRTDSTENQSIKIKVSTFTIHPNYNNPRKHENDVAILTLKHPIEFAINILPICLPSTPLNYNFVNATVAGWGSINTGITNKVSPCINKIQLLKLIIGLFPDQMENPVTYCWKPTHN